MTQPNDLPPLPEPDIESTQCRESTMRVDYITSHSSIQMTAYGLQCAEAAVERYAAQVRAALKAQIQDERLARDAEKADDWRKSQHTYAIGSHLEFGERLLQIK